jgi:hypothetical protein
MKKTTNPKSNLSLSRETLMPLTEGALANVNGGKGWTVALTTLTDIKVKSCIVGPCCNEGAGGGETPKK